ncbi:MAG: ATP-binding protein, partial [Balneolaceae bacterium]|nr:ATP-binding protein [Balneolaceae bacterium]
VGIQPALHTNIVDITADSDGLLWIASEGSGLQMLDPEDTARSAVYTRSNGLLGEIVFDVMEDREHNLWIAQSGGVSKLRYNFKAFRNLTSRSITGEQPVLPSPAINSVLPSAGERDPCALWAGTSERGITCIRGDFSSLHIGVEQGLISNWVNGLAYDEYGRLWGGTPKGINSIRFAAAPEVPGTSGTRSTVLFGRSGTIDNYQTSSILAVVKLAMPAETMGAERPHSIWFPAYHALYVLVKNRLYTIDDSWGLPAAIYHAAAFDDRGHLWAGSRDRGIYRSRKPLTYRLLHETAAGGAGKSVPLFEPWWTVEDGAPSNQIEYLLWHDGVMWAGTPRGLIALDGATGRMLEHLTTAEGLRADNATSMALSPVTGSLWVGTNQGLSEIDPDERTVLRTVTRQNGLVDNEVWFYGSVNADQRGMIYFGTANGLTLYDPSEDRRNEVPPMVRLTGTTVAEDPGERNEYSFEYAALSYGSERQVRYQTRLLGFNDNWSEEKTDVRANYTNLPAFFFPETYTFEVRAVNESGVWSAEPLSYAFSVTPAWWFRWWAFLGYFILFSAGVFAVDRIQRRRLLRKEREAAYLRETELKSEAAIARSKAAEAQAKALQAENDLKATELEKARELEKAYYELKSTQNRLIQSEKMASLGRLTTGIAHEMKNPLNFINNFAELSKELVEELKEALNSGETGEIEFILESLSSNAEKIEQHGKRADSIVASMVEHSQGGRAGYETVNLNVLVKNYAELALHSTLPEGSTEEIELSIDLDPAVPPLRLIGRKIGQALQNIIENAFDAVRSYRENGDGTFQPSIEIATRYDGASVEIRITDNGPGIPDTIRENIFEPFYTTKPTGKGTGLGLSFSYEIVTQLHNGELRVDNVPGGGASFVIILPAEEYAVKEEGDSLDR